MPDSLLRELKTRAALNGQSLKSLLNDLIQRAMRLPATSDLAQQSTLGPPILKRLQDATPTPMPVQSTALTNAELEDLTLQEDVEKLRRIGFIK
ncbi:MAG: hypothetical protein H7228_09100 [Polaromonas sp.]|nr:hypothetical protein [Polaromonas sp.]